MTNHFDDDLRRLMGDLDNISPGDLPGPAAARERGRARTRHQAVSATFAAMAAAAIAAVIVSGQPSFLAVPDPAEPTPTAPTPTESESPESTEVTAIPDDALLAAGGIWDYGGTQTADWAADAESEDEPACLPDLAGRDGVRDHARADFRRTSEGVERVTHELVLAASSADLFSDLRNRINECAPPRDPDQIPETPWIGEESVVRNVGDQAWVVRYVEPAGPDQDSGRFVTVGIVRRGDLVSVTTRWIEAMDTLSTPDYMTPANAADRACRETFGSSCLDGTPAADFSWQPVDINGRQVPVPDEPEPAQT